MAHIVMVIDKKRCIGCHTCSIACKSENNLPNKMWWNKTFTETGLSSTGDSLSPIMDMPTGTIPNDGEFVNTPSSSKITKEYYTLACQHCQNPPCLAVCPNGSTYRKESDGTIQVDPDKCIGCGLCVSACPYGVRVSINGEEGFHLSFPVGGQGIMPHKKNTVEKCTLCTHKLDKGELPACVDACIGVARFVGDLNDPMSIVSQKLKEATTKGRTIERLKESEGTKPSVYFIK